MTVPGPVPAKKRAGRPRAGGSRPPRYLTGDPSGWRFQLRLSPQFYKNGIDTRFGFAGPAPIVRATLGPRSRSEAKRLAVQLATLCQTICSFAADIWKGTAMDASQIDDKQNELARHTVEACQNAITRALEKPAQAIGLARGLEAALDTLQLVGREVARGEAGMPAVTANAEALTRAALADVLKLAGRSEDALAALAAVEQVAPSIVPMPAPATPGAAPTATAGLPLFSEISQKYIDMRIARDGVDHPEIPRLVLRRQTFIDVEGDRTPDKYFPSDLQDFVNKMQHFPSNVTKRADFAGKSTAEILEANKEFAIAPPMAKKTMANGYVANVKTMMRHGMQDHKYRDPLAGAQLSYPKAYLPSKPREGISVEVTNRVFGNGVKSCLLDEAMFPLLGKLTSRRLGLLTYLQGSDIRKKDGVWIAQTNGIVEVEDNETKKKTWKRVPIKTEESMTYYVLHNFLDEIGFIEWMRRQNGFVFEEAHHHPDPSKYMSKTMQNHLKRCGAKGGEVFHSLRGDAIDGMRKQKVDNRARRLQAGHELGDEHDKYGFRALSAEECQRLANLPLEDGIDWNVFKGLDFDAMARRRRTRGRRPKPVEG
ncbi:hypothetical protein ABIF34_007044 [Bradyrhizobium japonicum]